MKQMYISQEEFYCLLYKHIKFDKDLYISLLTNMIKNPERYTGPFRLSTRNDKLIQNITQSREIKFGKFFEHLVNNYIKRLDYTMLENTLYRTNSNAKKHKLDVDLLFQKDDVIYLVEMKIRDDHDSSKKVGEYQKFLEKVKGVKQKYSNYKKIIAIIRFVDDSFEKNKNYYTEKLEKENIKNVEFHLDYGEKFFQRINNGADVWSEILKHLEAYHSNLTVSDIKIPDFDTDPQIAQALMELDTKLFKKLISNEKRYKELRESLFSSNGNLTVVKEKRKL